jgi:pseudo-rSAM protein
MRTYWFYLEQYTFLFQNNEYIYVYNTLIHQNKKFPNQEKLKRLTTQLIEPKNMYCIELTEFDIENIEISNFIKFVRDSFSGDLLDKSRVNSKPIILAPKLNLQNAVEKLSKENGRSIGDDLLLHLTDLNFYIGGLNQSSALSNVAVYKQFDYSSFEKTKTLSLNSIVTFLDQLKAINLRTIKIFDEWYKYSQSELSSFLDKLETVPSIKNFNIHYKDILNHIDKFKLFEKTNCTVIILVDFPASINEIEQVAIRLNSISIEWLFAIKSENEFYESELYIEKLKLNQVQIKPVYIGSNLNFFKKYVFLSEDDIQKIKLSRKDIYSKQALNTLDFGKLTVMPDGKVYANPNFESLGTIEENISKILFIEFENGTSWRRIRNQGVCNNCIYQYICPSPSNYELAIGQPNLCSLNN